MDIHARMEEIDSQFDTVYINSIPHEVSGCDISYRQIVKLVNKPFRKDYSVTYSYARSSWRKGGILFYNQSIPKENGMSINIALTNNS